MKKPEEVAEILKKAQEAYPNPTEVEGTVKLSKPRFILFHSPDSVNSMIVRAVLAEMGLPYTSHII